MKQMGNLMYIIAINEVSKININLVNNS